MDERNMRGKVPPIDLLYNRNYLKKMLLLLSTIFFQLYLEAVDQNTMNNIIILSTKDDLLNNYNKITSDSVTSHIITVYFFLKIIPSEYCLFNVHGCNLI